MSLVTRFLFMLLLACAMQVHAELIIEGAYVRGLPPGTANTSAYMTIRNTSDQDMTLAGAESAIATSVMLHASIMQEGMMRMEHLAAAAIPAGGELVLKSGGTHLMLLNLQSMPMPGSMVPLTLRFGDGSQLELSVPVRSVLEE